MSEMVASVQDVEKRRKEKERRRREKRRERKLAEARVGIDSSSDKNDRAQDEDEIATEPESVAMFALPDLLVTVSFCLSRICCTQATAKMAWEEDDGRSASTPFLPPER